MQPSRESDERNGAGDPGAVERLAAAQGLIAIDCPSCSGRDPRCRNCGGSGRLWRGPAGATLSDEGVRRLASRR